MPPPSKISIPAVLNRSYISSSKSTLSSIVGNSRSISSYVTYPRSRPRVIRASTFVSCLPRPPFARLPRVPGRGFLIFFFFFYFFSRADFFFFFLVDLLFFLTMSQHNAAKAPASFLGRAKGRIKKASLSHLFSPRKDAEKRSRLLYTGSWSCAIRAVHSFHTEIYTATSSSFPVTSAFLRAAVASLRSAESRSCEITWRSASTSRLSVVFLPYMLSARKRRDSFSSSESVPRTLNASTPSASDKSFANLFMFTIGFSSDCCQRKIAYACFARPWSIGFRAKEDRSLRESPVFIEAPVAEASRATGTFASASATALSETLRRLAISRR